MLRKMIIDDLSLLPSHTKLAIAFAIIVSASFFLCLTAFAVIEGRHWHTLDVVKKEFARHPAFLEGGTPEKFLRFAENHGGLSLSVDAARLKEQLDDYYMKKILPHAFWEKYSDFLDSAELKAFLAEDIQAHFAHSLARRNTYSVSDYYADAARQLHLPPAPYRKTS
jgi:hypothetical protein